MKVTKFAKNLLFDEMHVRVALHTYILKDIYVMRM